ncbi:MAG: hypothetical protein GYA62_08955 [Bacteroidales bacterium]|nr:hypothetical protein [Bacteroidales bacterium]
MPKEAAKAWYDKAKKEFETNGDVFDRFIYLWFSFNILYSQHFENDERNAIKNFVDNDYLKIVSNATINDILSSEAAMYFYSRIIKNMRYIKFKVSNEWVTTRKNNEILKNKVYHIHGRLKNLLMILYQVRCNLFHGDKMYLRESDTEVVTYAANALEKILGKYLR